MTAVKFISLVLNAQVMQFRFEFRFRYFSSTMLWYMNDSSFQLHGYCKTEISTVLRNLSWDLLTYSRKWEIANWCASCHVSISYYYSILEQFELHFK